MIHAQEEVAEGVVRGGQTGVLAIVSTVPPTWNSPSKAVNSPARMRRIVVLPTPFGPTSAVCSPGVTPRS